MAKFANQNRQNFLKGFFTGTDETKALQVNNNWVLFKHFNRRTQQWQVDIFTKESFEAMKNKGELNH